jgi:hypothetical protein
MGIVELYADADTVEVIIMLDRGMSRLVRWCAESLVELEQSRIPKRTSHFPH